jgi:23S rRNA pseudoU1915 N3-methylase RlmH
MSFTDWFSPPQEINVDRVGELMQNKYVDQMGDRATSIMNPNSALNQALKNQLQSSIQSNQYTQNRINKANFAQSGIGGQSGIISQLAERGADEANETFSDHWKKMMNQNFQTSNQLLGQAGGLQNTINDAQTSAYGQNITNTNNYNSAMAGNVIQGGMSLAMMMCDKRVKKDIKPVGKIKTKTGEKVGLYNFKYKWSNKNVTGVMAQDVEKVNPKAVKKGKNGLKFVDMKELFG